MGLDINKYRWSYGMLQRLRSAALKVEKNKHNLDYIYNNIEGNTQFNAFIFHSDCEGSYKSIKGKTKRSKFEEFEEFEKYTEKWYMYGHSLEDLKAECKILDKSIREFLDERDAKAWQDFYDDVRSARRVLEFS